LHDLGQNLWLDNITRNLPDSGTLKRYIEELSITGLSSNPTIFDHCLPKAWYIIASLEMVGSTGTVPSTHSRHWKKSWPRLRIPREQQRGKKAEARVDTRASNRTFA
jgi:hypothetical protein